MKFDSILSRLPCQWLEHTWNFHPHLGKSPFVKKATSHTSPWGVTLTVPSPEARWTSWTASSEAWATRVPHVHSATGVSLHPFQLFRHLWSSGYDVSPTR